MNAIFETKEIKISANTMFSDLINDRFFDGKENETDFMRLIDSIENNGLINPIILAYDNSRDDMFEVICGRRRIRAIKEICKKNNQELSVPCRVLQRDTDRRTRNVIAFQDNENRKDLDDSVRFFPLYILVASSFYRLSQSDRNVIGKIKDDKLLVFLNKMYNNESVSDDETKLLIKELATEVKVDERILLKKLVDMAKIDLNFLRTKKQLHIQTKELLKYKNSDNQQVKTLLDEIFFVMEQLSLLTKVSREVGQGDDELEKRSLLDNINEKYKTRFGIELVFSEVNDENRVKQTISEASQKYIKEIKKVLADEKKEKSKNPNIKKVKSFLKNATDDEIVQILRFIENFSKDK